MTVAGVALAASLLVGLALQPLLIPWLRRRGVLDIPNERSSHVTATPRGGGLGVLLSLGVGLVVGRWGGSDVAVLLFGSVLLGAVGLIDDVRGLRATTRLGLLLAVGGVAGIFVSSPMPMRLVAGALLAVWVAAYVNAFNFMDGINGISALSGALAGASYLVIGTSLGTPALVVGGAAMVGACLSFLPYNLFAARVFLGDVGSYSLGFAISAMAWLAWSAGAAPLVALAPTSVYLADTGWTLICRFKEGRPLMEAHRSHVYQRIATTGRSHASVALFVVAVQTTVIVTVWWASSSDLMLVGALLSAGLLVGYLASPRYLTRETT